MEEIDLNYSRCPNCGKYFALEETIDKTNDEMFCSNDCKIYYKACVACGNFFTSSRTEDKTYCSDICGINPEVEDLPQELPVNPSETSREMALDNL